MVWFFQFTVYKTLDGPSIAVGSVINEHFGYLWTRKSNFCLLLQHHCIWLKQQLWDLHVLLQNSPCVIVLYFQACCFAASTVLHSAEQKPCTCWRSILLVAYDFDALVYAPVHLCQICAFMVEASDWNYSSSYLDLSTCLLRKARICLVHCITFLFFSDLHERPAVTSSVRRDTWTAAQFFSLRRLHFG